METLIQQMKVILATNFSLYLKAHNYHWNIEGKDFPQFHGFLDTLYNSVWAQTDNIAEHLRMLGVYAPGSYTRFTELSDILEATSVPSAMGMMNILKDDNDRFIIHLRAGIVAADDAHEPAVSNFLQDLLGAHQKHAWMLRSIIKE
jgi:starvation-inducible DNA-binding protein